MLLTAALLIAPTLAEDPQPSGPGIRVVDETGALARGDGKLDAGEYFDVYVFEAAVGDVLRAEVRAGSFDTYLALRKPSGALEGNDDCDGRKDLSCLTLTADEAGSWVLVVTSFKKKEKGDYSAVVTQWPGGGGSAATVTATARTPTTTPATSDLIVDVSSSLDRGDNQLDDGEYVELHAFHASAGDVLVADVRSSAFDTYAGLMGPGGDVHENDDFNGSKDHSQVAITADVTGEWNLLVTSYKGGETGPYTATVGTERAEAPGATLSKRGELARGDDTLSGGEFYDTFPFQAQAGEALTATLRASAFDTYVVLTSPSGEAWGNDDFENSKDHSQITVTADATGEWNLVVTSYQGGETGSYDAAVTRGAAATPQAAGGEHHTGSLSSSDDTLPDGEYVDVLELKGKAGDHVVIDLRGQGFDTYLGLVSPGEEVFQNDDHESSSERSQLSLTLAETGTWKVLVTSYGPAETGAWTLDITRADTDNAETGPREERGTLAQGDTQLESGEYFDLYTVEGLPGQQLRVDVSSTAFDTFLVLIHPDETSEENDDSPETAGHSLIESQLTEAGTYTVGVTSYKPAETGDYVLTLTLDDGHATLDTAQRDVGRLSAGTAVEGQLAEGDSTLETGELRDIYTFDGTAGQAVSVQLRSSDFDTYVGIQLLSGEFIENDDWESRRDQSRVELELPETGRYKVVATSYSPATTGTYSLVVQAATSGSVLSASNASNASTGNIYGVFVGISDYPGDNNDLSYTADDAVILKDSFVRSAGMDPANGIVLTDTDATRAAVHEAMAELGGRMGPDDRFVFFFSGHGVRVPRKGEFQSADPDGQDETLAMYDEQVTDDEFSVWLDEIPGTALIVLDACFSGGFAKDIISKPGRMGLFSSQEDVTSAVAVKFRAGGYLARFMADAIGERLADDGDGQLTALELSQYIYDRYRTDVRVMTNDPPAPVMTVASDKAAPQIDYVLISRNLGYQQLVVDRGGVSPYEVLFSW